MTAPSTTPGRGYQGYPYSNPLVIDVPSIDPVTASTWANLPRNPIIPGQNASRSNPDTRIQNGNRDNSSFGNSNFKQRNTSNVKPESDVAEYPVVYIDFPTNEMGEYIGGDNTTEENGTSTNNSRNDQSNFVQDTIFYDPFEDRRIDVAQNPPTSTGSTPAETHSLSDLPSPQPQQSGSSGLGGSSSSSHTGHPFRSKETQVYNPRPRVDDSFLQSTIPASQFPAPPPAYTEIDRTIEPPPPPRTEVIVPENTCPARKLISCNFCGQRVYTLAIKQNGALTHVLAILFIFVFAPLAIVVYCTDVFKYRNHYCPNCNKLIGYEVPILCQGMVYTKSS